MTALTLTIHTRRNLVSLPDKKAGLTKQQRLNMNIVENMKTVDTTNTVNQRPLFPKGRPHLIAVSKSVDAKRAVPPILSHAGIDPIKILFVEATAGDRVVDIEEKIKPDTEVIVVWNLPALVRYKVRSDQRVLKMMREL